MAKASKNLEHLENHLEPAEELMAHVEGTYETKIMGSQSVRKGILAATDRRMVFFAKKVGGYGHRRPASARAQPRQTTPRRRGEPARRPRRDVDRQPARRHRLAAEDARLDQPRGVDDRDRPRPRPPVKRWSSGEMALRWATAGMHAAESQFRRVKGYRELPALAHALEQAVGYQPDTPDIQHPVTVTA